MVKERIWSVGNSRTTRTDGYPQGYEVVQHPHLGGAMIKVREDDHYVERAERVRALTRHTLQHESYCLSLLEYTHANLKTKFRYCSIVLGRNPKACFSQNAGPAGRALFDKDATSHVLSSSTSCGCSRLYLRSSYWIASDNSVVNLLICAVYKDMRSLLQQQKPSLTLASMTRGYCSQLGASK
jgi:hypothetical protein